MVICKLAGMFVHFSLITLCFDLECSTSVVFKIGSYFTFTSKQKTNLTLLEMGFIELITRNLGITY